MNEPSLSAAPVSGYIVVDVDDLVPFGSITWEAVFMGCDSAIAAIRGASWSPREASDLSERMESKEVTDGVFERFGEMVWSSPLQETMRVAMRCRDKRTRVQSDFTLFRSLAPNVFPYFGSEVRSARLAQLEEQVTLLTRILSSGASYGLFLSTSSRCNSSPFKSASGARQFVTNIVRTYHG